MAVINKFFKNFSRQHENFCFLYNSVGYISANCIPAMEMNSGVTTQLNSSSNSKTIYNHRNGWACGVNGTLSEEWGFRIYGQTYRQRGFQLM
jgi:hypothetical protein